MEVNNNFPDPLRYRDPNDADHRPDAKREPGEQLGPSVDKRWRDKKMTQEGGGFHSTQQDTCGSVEIRRPWGHLWRSVTLCLVPS